MMAQLVPRFGDADFGNREGVTLSPEAEGGHSGHIRLEGQNDQVVHGAEIVARHGGGDIPVRAGSVRIGDGGQRGVEPGVGPPGADLSLADRSQVLFHPALVRRAHLLLELPNFREVGVQDAPPAAQRPSLGRGSPLGRLEQRGEDLAAAAHRREANAISGPSQ